MVKKGSNTVLSRIVTDEEGIPQFYRGRNGKYISIVPNKLMLIQDAPGTGFPYTMYLWQTKEETQLGKFITLEEVEDLKRKHEVKQLIPSNLVHSIQ